MLSKARDELQKEIDHTNESGYGLVVVGSRKNPNDFDLLGVNLYTARRDKVSQETDLPHAKQTLYGLTVRYFASETGHLVPSHSSQVLW